MQTDVRPDYPLVPVARSRRLWPLPRLTARFLRALLLFLIIINPNRAIYFSYLGTQPPKCCGATFSTSVLNAPSFTTHDLLRLLWQSSPYSDRLKYSLTQGMDCGPRTIFARGWSLAASGTSSTMWKSQRKKIETSNSQQPQDAAVGG
jgi:hypothetical protein